MLDFGGTRLQMNIHPVDLASPPTLLSQVLVAFTIEFDNEFERQMPHRTTIMVQRRPRAAVHGLVSLVMWSNCMQFIDEHGFPSLNWNVSLARERT